EGRSAPPREPRRARAARGRSSTAPRSFTLRLVSPSGAPGYSPTVNMLMDCRFCLRRLPRSAGHRIPPSEPRKAGEVRITRVQLGLVLDCERRQMRVGREVPRGPNGLEKSKNDHRMTVPGMENGHLRLREPRTDVIACRPHGHGMV